MPNLATTKHVAERLNISPGRVRQIADRLALGWKPTSRMRLFTEDDIRAIDLDRKAVGRPRKETAS